MGARKFPPQLLHNCSQEESPEEEEDGVVAVSEFDFASYLEESGQEGVPEGAFAHVDASGMIHSHLGFNLSVKKICELLSQ